VLTATESFATQLLGGDGRMSTASNWSPSNRLDAADNYEVRGVDGFVDASDNFSLLGSGKNLIIGSASNATVTMSGGIFNVNGFISMQSTSFKTGTFNMVSGTLTLTNDIRVAFASTASRGVFNVSGGTLNANNIIIGNTNANMGVVNYTGGQISCSGAFKLFLNGELNFELGNPAITVGTAREGGGAIGLLFDGGYSHVGGVTNILIQSASKTGDEFNLITDSGNVSMTNGAAVTVSGRKFTVLNTSTQLGLISVSNPTSIKLIVISN
jgi:hypothetical protein